MTIVDDAEFVRWAESAPAVLRTDPLWSLNAYRVSIYLLDRAKADVATIRRARRLHRTWAINCCAASLRLVQTSAKDWDDRRVSIASDS